MQSSPTTTVIGDVTTRAVGQNVPLILGEVSQTVTGIDSRALADLAVLLTQAERVFVAGAGRSGLVLRMAAMRLMHLGLNVHVAGETTTPAIGHADLLLVASGSGTTAGVVNAAETAAKAGAQVAAFTANAGSPLAEVADMFVLISAPQKTDHDSGASRQYSGSLFEQSLFLATEAVFHVLWERTSIAAEQLWTRHANLE